MCLEAMLYLELVVWTGDQFSEMSNGSSINHSLSQLSEREREREKEGGRGEGGGMERL